MKGKKCNTVDLLKTLPAGARQYVIDNNIKLGRIPSNRGAKKYSNTTFLEIDEGHDILEYFLVVKHYMARKYNVSIRLFEILFYLYKRNAFTGHDYYDMPKPFTYNQISTLIKFGYIIMVHKNRTKLGSLFTLSRKAKFMVRDFYKYLSGEKKIPEINNPLNTKDATAIDKMRFNLIKKMNSMEPDENKKRLFGKNK